MVALCEKFRRTFQLKRKDGRLTGLPIDGRNIFSIPPVPGYIDEYEVQKWAMELAGEYNYARQHADEATAPWRGKPSAISASMPSTKARRPAA